MEWTLSHGADHGNGASGLRIRIMEHKPRNLRFGEETRRFVCGNLESRQVLEISGDLSTDERKKMAALRAAVALTLNVIISSASQTASPTDSSVSYNLYVAGGFSIGGSDPYILGSSFAQHLFRSLRWALYIQVHST